MTVTYNNVGFHEKFNKNRLIIDCARKNLAKIPEY